MTEIAAQLQNLPLDEEMKDSYLTYAMSVIMARALPDVRDGLKPSQRRILVAMNDLQLGPRSKHRKCAKISGDTSGNYHPHGEQVIYPTLVRLAQSFAMRYPLVDGQGNFGTIDGDPPAAMRYTEARMAPPATDLLDDLKLDTVDFQPNYDETRTEPTVLPGKFPNLLVNGSQGIAVGMMTNIPPHNLTEVCNALIKLIDEPETTVDELAEIVTAPDFPTGGLICGRYGILEAYRTGRGAVTIRAKMHTEDATKGKKTLIVVDEIPYNVLKTTITQKIAQCVKDGLIPDISDVRDESDRKGMRLVVELKRDANVDVVTNQLYQYTQLQHNLPIINIALVNRQPMTLTLKQMLEYYILHRKDVIRRRTQFLLKRARTRAHILEGLILAVADIDEIIQLIRTSPDPPTAKQRLIEKPLRLSESATLRALLPESFVDRAVGADQFLSGPQADAILSMQLQRLTGLEIEKLAKDYAELVEQIEGYEAILRDEALLLDIIREDIYEMRDKYGDDRRSEIVAPVGGFKMEDLIAEENVIVTMSHAGYIKRTPVESYRAQGRGGKGVRGSDNTDDDFLEHLFCACTHDYLLFFTTRGRLYWLKVYDIPSMQRTARGRSIANLLDLHEEESVTSVLPVREFGDRFVVMATAKGIIKKTPLGAFSNPRQAGIIAINLDPDDSLIGASLTGGVDDIMLGTADGLAIRFSEEDVRPMGRTARGVKGISLGKGDHIVDMIVIEPDASVLTVCEKGYGKRTDFDEYRSQSRGGKGLINIKTTDRNGKVVALRTVTDDDELMLIGAKGLVIRFSASDLRQIGRATQGVRLIRIEDGDRIVAVARLAPEENGEIEDKGTKPAGAADESPAPADKASDAPGEDAPSDTDDVGDTDDDNETT